MFPTKESLTASLAAADLPTAHADLARPAALLRPEAGEPARVGESRFGGHPDLPPHLNWPRELPFLAVLPRDVVNALHGG
ncbi:hypothetical protein [Corynebacterium nasicanis]|uniref:Uncharacterized protein n=1 Tax=Corynebacterium nasicanis TaxID=1448267 RepID=A0ABW1Q7K7_9CORY